MDAPENKTSIEEKFRRISSKIAKSSGSIYAFFLAFLTVLVWVSFGPYFKWSDSHSLLINTITSIATFLMVFVIQNSQNRDTRALHLKLDEVILALHNARNEFVKIENLSDKDLKALEERSKTVKESALRRRRRRKKNKT